jgi:hypothetical protein
MSPFHNYLEELFVPLLRLEEGNVERLNWQGVAEAVLKRHCFIFTFEGCTLCPSPVS